MTRLVYAEKEEEPEKWFNLCIFLFFLLLVVVFNGNYYYNK